MPWADVNSGSLGVSTLKAALARDEIASDIAYFNLSFAKQLGVTAYSLVSQLGGRGEIFFTPHFFRLPTAEFAERDLPQYTRNLFAYLRDSVDITRYGDEDAFGRTCADLVRTSVPAFVDRSVESIAWERYDIVGFSLMFDQTLASLCLARAIKARHPHISIVFGGANCDGEMGVEMLRSFDCVDVVARGEADETIVRLVRALRAGAGLDACPGIVYRDGARVVETPPAPAVTNMDALPRPDYTEYVAATRDLASAEPFKTSLFFESSRGCWWGQKHLCSFCGLNANTLAFRRKSPQRVLDELLAQEREHGLSTFVAADNIVDFSYFNTLLPQIAAINEARPADRQLSLFYETKSNLKKAQIRLLYDAGVRMVQPGIESFSDHVLEMMKKGCTGMQQVQFIKWATEIGLSMVYGVLYGNPGETVEDYQEMADAVRFLRHLQPPTYVTAIALDRFSPYFNNPAAYGIRNVRPPEWFRRVFPSAAIDHHRLSYHFAFDHDDYQNATLRQAVDRCREQLLGWRRSFQPDRLAYAKHDGIVYILDRRRPTAGIGTLRRAQAAIFEYCDEHHSFDGICRRFPTLPPERVRECLDALVAREWMYRDRRDHFIALPIERPFVLRAVKAAVVRASADLPAEARPVPGDTPADRAPIVTSV
jgi:ribosomal peptide maturation radical SAM protein 1